MENRHERRLAAEPERVIELLGSLASAEDRVWPSDRWPAVRLDRGLAVGSAGGHGFVRYHVEEVGACRVVMRFEPVMRLDGTHRFEIEPVAGGTVLRHVLEARPRSWMRLAWPVLVAPLHDALVEDALDGVEARLAGRPLTRAAFRPGVRRRRRLVAALPW